MYFFDVPLNRFRTNAEQLSDLDTGMASDTQLNGLEPHMG
jgi:hypothetical protein